MKEAATCIFTQFSVNVKESMRSLKQTQICDAMENKM